MIALLFWFVMVYEGKHIFVINILHVVIKQILFWYQSLKTDTLKLINLDKIKTHLLLYNRKLLTSLY